jgi:tubby-related protein 1
LGTEYQIFDDGVNPKDADADDKENRSEFLFPIDFIFILNCFSCFFSDSNVRCELAGVTYAATFVSAAPRKMQVTIPAVETSATVVRRRGDNKPSEEKPMVWKDNNGPLGEDDSLISRIKNKSWGRKEEISYLINKPPRWNETIGGYVLNFHGRVTMASVKNFQLVDPEDMNRITLQFGKIGKDDFSLDLQWPMTPLQAFAIVLSSFDSKIACD